ncbi:hypothetical protein LTR66_014480, partial [Elasticomyces elasticus]
RIRKTAKNSLSIISEANSLKEQLLQWEPPDVSILEQLEDPSITARDVLLTAEAYRRAILLHLESAVIELSSNPPQEQAMEILTLLATTPMSSRALIVQIFPLLIGSCEVTSPDDREWVTGRWEVMIKRLGILNVTSCWEVVKEVWQRRDQWTEMQAQRMSQPLGRRGSFSQSPPRSSGRQLHRPDIVRTSSSRDNGGHARRDGPTAGVATEGSSRPRPARRQIALSMLNENTEYTVRGHLHWLGIMSDWKWEVFL